MLKIACVVDKTGSAIDRLAKGRVKYNTNLEYIVCDVHPKRASTEQLQRFEEAARDADVIDMHYFRSGEMLLKRYPWLKDKKLILSHFNPYSITESDWNHYDLIVAPNREIYEKLGSITTSPVEYIPLTVDTDFWKFNQDWQPNNNVIMVCNRIEGKKGILPVAKACREAGLNFHLVGAISDMNYFNEIAQTGAIFHQEISDEELRDLYYKSTIHVCNSVDFFESGTMPILESMLCGVPVLTRNIGHVPELNNGENMVLHEGDPEDVETIKGLLQDMLMDKEKLKTMRDNAWQTAKTKGNQRRAFEYQKLYRQLLYPNMQSVSVVIPVFDRPEIVRKCLDAVARQTYKNIEIIVADDSLDAGNQKLVHDFASYVNFPVRYMNTGEWTINRDHPNGYKSYGLARARNEATVYATGEVMVYCDQRMIMEPNAIEEFVKYAKPRHWIYGNKGVNNRPMVENFSCLYKRDIVRFGGFSERGITYGFQSQYCRSVAREQALKTEECKSAHAIPTGKSSNRNRKRQDIIQAKDRLYMMGLE